MIRSFNQRRTQYEGWVVSFIFHGLLSILFIVIIVEKPIEYSDYMELSFSSYQPGNKIVTIPDETAIIPPVQQQIIDEALLERKVEIPQRRMTERSTDVIPEEDRSKLDIDESTEKISGISDPLQGMERETGNPEEITLPGNRPEYSSSNSITDKKITSLKPSVGTSSDYTIEKPYEISWEGFEREIQYDPLPAYPSGVNKEVRIKIRITVLPDGTVGNMIPLQKGDAILESITMKTLKQWRLNPLEPSALQVNQSGIITFRFVLE